MNLSDVAFQLTRCSLKLNMLLGAEQPNWYDIGEVASEIATLTNTLGELSVHITDILDERNARISTQQMKVKFNKP